MQTQPLRVRLSCVLLACTLLPVHTLRAQSGSTVRGSTTAPLGSNLQPGSGTVGSGMAGSTTAGSGMAGSGTAGSGMAMPGANMNAPVAMGGYCPVCILDMKKWIKGKPNFSVVLDGKKYLFPGEPQKQKFLASTNLYTPALGGDCVICAMDGGARMAGSIHYAAIHRGRLFMFPGEKEKATFMSNPRKYENFDLAFNGNCAVCRVEMQQETPGSKQVGTMHGGMRYYFPNMDHKKMFLANPAKYTVKKQ